MNIAIIGYGKMGKAVEKIAKQRGHTIKLKINIESKNIDYAGIDVAIDFSSPESAPELIQESLKNKVPTVSGTTGWLEKMPQIENLCQLNDTAFLYSSNFSIETFFLLDCINNSRISL